MGNFWRLAGMAIKSRRDRPQAPSLLSVANLLGDDVTELRQKLRKMTQAFSNQRWGVAGNTFSVRWFRGM